MSDSVNCELLAKELLAMIGKTEPDVWDDNDDGSLGVLNDELVLKCPWPCRTPEQLHVIAHEVFHGLQTRNLDFFYNTPIKFLELEAEMFAYQFLKDRGIKVSDGYVINSREYVGSFPETIALEVIRNREVKAVMYRAYRTVKPQAEAWINGLGPIPNHQFFTIFDRDNPLGNDDVDNVMAETFRRQADIRQLAQMPLVRTEPRERRAA